jgi:hypothetical protein
MLDPNDIHYFDPVLFSHEEGEFLLENLGKPPVVALKGLPTEVNIAAVKPLLQRVYDLDQLKQHEGQDWIGIESIKAAIRIYQREDKKWAADHTRNKKAPRFPSLYSFDARGRAHRGGPGSDSGRVRTYFGKAGERIPFAIELIPSNEGEWIAPTMTEAPIEKHLRLDNESHRLECRVPLPDGKICGHAETFKPDSRSSYNAARGRMSRHLRRATENVDDHRELHTNEFGN